MLRQTGKKRQNERREEDEGNDQLAEHDGRKNNKFDFT
jgi:hypothetical protein